MLEHNLDELDTWCALQMARLSPVALRRLQRDIGYHLREQNRKRIKAQTGADGQRWAPRKPDTGDGKGKMYKKLKQNKHLKIRHTTNGLRVGWFNRVGRIARTHHYGLREELKHGVAEYPARPLLGITAADKAGVQEIILRHLSEAP
ncbi:phage virion morphogenesis protein [Rappaport israeli]|uniref:phage virion morphogenesis protein n=1 Tax=Rappaport israeli TaxID=1839807 RepID=UPI000930352E|nr:phage virion morphogenesis protein [Rappaport israeli]